MPFYTFELLFGRQTIMYCSCIFTSSKLPLAPRPHVRKTTQLVNLLQLTPVLLHCSFKIPGAVAAAALPPARPAAPKLRRPAAPKLHRLAAHCLRSLSLPRFSPHAPYSPPLPTRTLGMALPEHGSMRCSRMELVVVCFFKQQQGPPHS
jgi:hypothetical protein